MPPNARLAGLIRKETDEDDQPLVPFVFAEVSAAEGARRQDAPAAQQAAAQSLGLLLGRAPPQRLPARHAAAQATRASCASTSTGKPLDGKIASKRQRSDSRSLTSRGGNSWHAPALSRCSPLRMMASDRQKEARFMSRTTLCVVTAAGLALLSLGVMIARYHVLGDEVKVPHGPGTWKVTMVVQRQAARATARLHDRRRRSTSAGSTSCARRATAASCSIKPARRHSTPSAAPGPLDAARRPCRRPVPGPLRVLLHRRRPPADAAHDRLAQAARTRLRSRASISTASRWSDDGRCRDHRAGPPADRRPGAAGVMTRPKSLFRYVDQEIGNEPSLGGPRWQRGRVPEGRQRRLRRPRAGCSSPCAATAASPPGWSPA